MKKLLKKVTALSCCLMMVLSMTACGKTNDAKDTSGDGEQEITVMVPPWAEPSSELLKSFTEETGIKVTLNIVGWDDIRNKVSIAAAGNKAPADVIEVDWSWVGEFGAADWFEPIEMSEEEMAGMPTTASFMYGDKLLALPYANDYRLGYYNKNHFEQVGVTEAPATWDELLEACKKIKEEGVCEYPMAFTLSATEAATTSLLWMTLSRYGDFYNDDFSVNEDNVLGALKEINALVKEDQLIDPANQNMKDVEIYEKITSGATSFMVGPTYFVGRINNPEYCSVMGELAPTLVPGNDSIKTATFALPEGVGISKFSENKDAALKFVEWYTSPETQVAMYGEQGNIPTRTVALEQLIEDGVLIDGEVMIEQSEYIASPFPGGIPSWYSEMSNTIYNSVNQMITESLTPEQAYEKIETKVDELRE